MIFFKSHTRHGSRQIEMGERERKTTSKNENVPIFFAAGIRSARREWQSLNRVDIVGTCEPFAMPSAIELLFYLYGLPCDATEVIERPP